MMKWTRLQLNTLPVVAIEADTAIQKLQQLTHRINVYAHNDDIQAFNQLRQSMLNRIQALDRFYQKNYLDSSIAIFHMIKLKLKRAVFKVQQLSNDTMSIQLMSQIHKKDSQSLMASNQSWYKHGEELLRNQQNKKKQQNFKIQAKPKSKSKSKIKLKTQCSRGRDQIFNDQDQETDLMEEININQFYKRKQSNNQDKSYQWNHKIDNDEPLFKSSNQNKEVFSSKKQLKPNNRSFSKSKDKSLSPLIKKQLKKQSKVVTNKNMKSTNDKIIGNSIKNENNIFKTSNKQITSLKSNKQLSGNRLLNQNDKTFKNSKVLNTNSNKVANKKTEQKQKVGRPLKTQGQQIIQTPTKTNDNMGQFRFTIKMTKQEYKNLLQMKQMLKNGKIQ